MTLIKMEPTFAKGAELAKSYQSALNRFEQFKEKECVKKWTCPKCLGVGFTTDKWEFIETDTGRVKIAHPEICNLCKGRREIPTKELIDF